MKRTEKSVAGKRKRELERDARLKELEQGFRKIALVLEGLGKRTGLLGGDGGIAHVPELSQLTKREWDVVSGVLEGYRVSGIAQKLAISPYTVRNHLRGIFRKVGVRSQSELMGKLRRIAPP